MAFATYLVYEERIRRALECHQGDAAINEQENRTEMGQEPRGSKTTGLTRLMGIVLLVVAVLFWVTAPAVPLTPLSTAQKVWTSSAFLVLGEVAFWVAAVVLGRRYSGATGGISIPAAGWARNVVERVRGYTQDLALLPPAPPEVACPRGRLRRSGDRG